MVFPIGIIAIILALSGGLLFCGYRLYRLKQTASTSEISMLAKVEHEKELTSELNEMKEKLARNLIYDSLTGLPGRQVFEDRLLQVMIQSKRYQLTFAVLFLDVDGFRVINEALGHDVGDELLKELAFRLQQSVRQVDTVSRFVGDEFVFLLPQLAKAETVAYVARRLLDTIAQPLKVRDQELFITASIGIAIYPNDGDEVKTLLKNADNALHQAKARGRNIFQFFRKEMYAISQRELLLSSSLQSPLVYQDFSLFYQPQVNVETKVISSMQALLQWQHPDLGLIDLHEFSRLAESSGKIIGIGEWLLQNAFQQFQKWQGEEFFPHTLSIGVSSRQLENPHFTYKISQILQDLKLEPATLIVEISEGLLLSKLDLIEKSTHMLKHLGVQIAIADFGTGHLSLQHLKRLPIDFLKISGTITQDITVNKESEAIVRMIVALANSLKITLVAEGVESVKQKQMLQELGCHILQGNFFSIPRRPDEFTIEKLNAIVAG